MLIPVVLAFATSLSGSPALAQGLVGTQDKTQGMTLTQVTSNLGYSKGDGSGPTGATSSSSRASTRAVRSTRHTSTQIRSTFRRPKFPGRGRSQTIPRTTRRRLPGVDLHTHIRAEKRQPHRGLLPSGHAAEVRRGLSKSQVAAETPYITILRPCHARTSQRSDCPWWHRFQAGNTLADRFSRCVCQSG